VQDVLFRNNVLRNGATGFVALGTDNEKPSQFMRRVAIINNLWQVSRTFFGIASGPGALEDLVVEHNTAVPAAYSTFWYDGRPQGLIRFRLTANVAGFGSYGVSFPKADAKLAKFAPGAILEKNALVNLADSGDGQGAKRNLPGAVDQAMYTSFPSAAAAGLASDGSLTPKSPLRRAGAGTTDLGVDFADLQRSMTEAWSAR
jgi:hypothetical protein